MKRFDNDSLKFKDIPKDELEELLINYSNAMENKREDFFPLGFRYMVYHEADCWKCGKKFTAYGYFKNPTCYICADCQSNIDFKEMEKKFEQVYPDTIPPRISRTLNDLFDSFKDRPDELRAEIEKLVSFLNERFPFDEQVYPYYYSKINIDNTEEKYE